MTKTLRFGSALMIVLCLSLNLLADVRLKQRVTMSGQKFESTRSIKGQRERTEQRMEFDDPAMADYIPQIATITQCDLKRWIKVNDRKQLYFIEPFPEPADSAAPAGRPVRDAANTSTKRGGTMTMTYALKDTGERKMMFGLQARHLIFTQEMETSADACSGPSKMKIEYDGWYVDFSADFSCPMPSTPAAPQVRPSRPDCIDRIVMKGTGTPPRGIMIEGTMKMFGADGSVQMTQTTETIELSRSPLEASLFEIPQSYRLVSSSQELYSVTMPTFGVTAPQRRAEMPTTVGGTAPRVTPSTAKSVAVSISVPPNSTVSQAEVDQYVRSRIAARGLRAVAGTGDYSVNFQIRQIKESLSGKIGGLFGKVTGSESKAGKVDIDLSAYLTGGATGEARVKNKFDGPPADAVRAAVDQVLNQLLSGIKP